MIDLLPFIVGVAVAAVTYLWLRIGRDLHEVWTDRTRIKALEVERETLQQAIDQAYRILRGSLYHGGPPMDRAHRDAAELLSHVSTDGPAMSASQLTEGMSVEEMTLANLAQITENRRLAQASWERAIDAALAAGIPERKIGKAAGISGPAVHQRKRRAA